ncbi:alternate-type signal peptide domain-containing protein [Microbacterium foliorum]|uniref:Alternate-type signal peptide domain-containing protein n=2 Tax=Microbacterium TaxID=33882 RepID=A0A4Y5YU84_9MICO|nr:alternate-type signal peptide domain-containing protein [Microbacterium foliorum]QDE36374.1 alternate-type signal peptide domain-containing protein [Microbacterium foliorum]
MVHILPGRPYGQARSDVTYQCGSPAASTSINVKSCHADTHVNHQGAGASMRKVTKATIAGALGVVLLTGGTTFALWSDSANVNGGTVNSGTLALTPSGTPAWNDISTPTPVPITIADFLIVPGDTIEYTAAFTVDASGDNLSATLDVSDPVAATGDAALLAATTVTQTFTYVGGEPVTDGAITSADDGEVINVTVTIVFDESTPGTTAQAESINLSDMTITLQQDAR